MLRGSDDQVAVVEPELLGLIGHDRERLTGVDDGDLGRPHLALSRGAGVGGDRPLDRDRALDLHVLRGVEPGVAEHVATARDLHRTGPVAHQKEQDPAGRARANEPASDTHGRAHGVGGEDPLHGAELTDAHWYSRHL